MFVMMGSVIFLLGVILLMFIFGVILMGGVEFVILILG